LLIWFHSQPKTSPWCPLAAKIGYCPGFWVSQSLMLPSPPAERICDAFASLKQISYVESGV